MGDKCRNCYSCAYFPCNYYLNFNVDKNSGCIYWTDEVKQNYLSNNTNDFYVKSNITDGTNSEHANISDGTHIIDSRKGDK